MAKQKTLSIKERFDAKGQPIKAWARARRVRYGLALDVINDNVDIGPNGSATRAVLDLVREYIGD